MRKAHLFDALAIVNQGIDKATFGLQKLKKATELTDGAYAEALLVLENRRAIVNMQFFTDMKNCEQNDAERFERHARELTPPLAILNHDASPNPSPEPSPAG